MTDVESAAARAEEESRIVSIQLAERELWSGLEDIRRLASGTQVVLADLVDKSTAPAKAGLRNGAEWIAQQSGGSLRPAYDQVATSKRLGGLPDVTAEHGPTSNDSQGPHVDRKRPS